MIGLLVLVILVWNFYIGYRRGLFLQGYYLLSVILAMLVAGFCYQSLADALTLWVPYASPGRDATVSFFTNQNIFNLDRVFYAGVAYFVIYVASYYLLRLVGVFLHFLTLDRLDQPRFRVIAGVLASLVSLVPLTMMGNILATIPLTAIQNPLASSWVARFLINSYFPVSQIIQNLWTSVI